MGKRTIPYEYAESIKSDLLDIYVKGGRKGVSSYLGISYNGTGHLLSRLGFYSDDVKMMVKEERVKKARSPQHKNVFEVLDDTSLYILGFIVGDGCILSPSKSEAWERACPNALDISCNDYRIIKDIANAFEMSDDFIGKYDYNGKHHATYSLRTNDYNTIQSLFALGVRPRKSECGCKVDISKDQYGPFVRGLLDSDGYVRIYTPENSNQSVRVCIGICGHHSYLNQVIENTDFNWKSEINDEGLSYINLYSQDEVKRFYNWVYKGATLKLDRKYLAMYYCFEKGEVYGKYREYSHD